MNVDFTVFVSDSRDSVVNLLQIGCQRSPHRSHSSRAFRVGLKAGVPVVLEQHFPPLPLLRG